ncbi:FAD-dependent oxidoreductase [Noviherbaspirillum sp. DKR-6]|uniref:FAD-dependent oxidoreductase n=2 Tax=Noviherbaspirillum pedocola TaxID=2801341 RepID=A0A934WAC0_9BURK|nr:FAD-dependent oxidoreductase [Noviherbaspirillum pedocola]
MLPRESDVLVVGGGPCGLMLANELGRRGVSVTIVDEKPGTAFNPQANATQARTMEHFRRLGFALEIRKAGLPPDFPTDIAYFTRFARHELGRFKLPSAREATKAVTGLSGAWSAAELPHRVSQKFVEAELRRQAEKLPGVSVNYGWRMVACRDMDDHVEIDVEPSNGGPCETLRGAYLLGADGARSAIRQHLGFRYTGETGIRRDFMGGRMYAIYLRAPAFYEMVPHAPAWMNVSFNQERRAFMAAVDGRGEFAFHTQLRAHEDEERITEDDARAMFQAACGAPIPADVLSRGGWTAGHCLVADHFRKGRIFIGGDAAHLFTPTGGLGYNTAVEDAVNLAWKLAAVLKGQASPQLLDSYELERRPLAVRNTSYARGFADSLGHYAPAAEIEDDSPAGETARAQAGEYLASHGRKEFNIPGITFGGRYDGSPAIVGDGTAPPPDTANNYIPTACPGGRPPHLWIGDGRSLYDVFGFEWTLLCLGAHPPSSDAFSAAAQRLGLSLKVVDLPQQAARDLYEADLALIRPDQIVGWRGSSADAADGILRRLTGWDA